METSPSGRAKGIVRRVWDFYIEGFRGMRLGKTLWMIILIKLFVFFAVMKWLFFPDILKRDYATDAERAEAVREHLTGRQAGAAAAETDTADSNGQHKSI